MDIQRASQRLLNSALAAFCSFTLVWIAWGIATPGDYFANGGDSLYPSLGLASVGGMIIGFRVSNQ
jgi:hypothetical protein